MLIGNSLASIAESLKSIVARSIPLDELRMTIEEYEGDYMTAEDEAEYLLQRYDIREKL